MEIGNEKRNVYRNYLQFLTRLHHKLPLNFIHVLLSCLDFVSCKSSCVMCLNYSKYHNVYIDSVSNLGLFLCHVLSVVMEIAVMESLVQEKLQLMTEFG